MGQIKMSLSYSSGLSRNLVDPENLNNSFVEDKTHPMKELFSDNLVPGTPRMRANCPVVSR